MVESTVDDRLLELERVIAEVVDYEGVTRLVLEPLEKLSGATGNMLFAFVDGPAPTALGGSLMTVMQGYSADLFSEDALQRYSYTLPGSTFSTGQLPGFDVEAFRRSRPYADFYRPNGIGFVHVLWPTGLSYGQPGMFGLFLSRPTLEAFPRSVDRTLRHLEQPLRAMARRIAQFAALKGERDVLRRLLELRRGAFVLWDRDGRAVWRSREAGTYLRRKGLLDELCRLASQARRQARNAASVSLELSVLGRQRHLRAGGAELLVQFWSIAECDGPWLVAELEPATAPPLAKGLSPAEIRVASCLSRGLSNKEISHALSISVETVKTHVVRILRKLGVDSRAKAATLIRDAEAAAPRLPLLR